ncbi:LysR family transcriptional regulator [Bdellovibrio bacteriovorus]
MSLLSPSLEAFWAVVKTGTVLEAATLVNLTQTGVTQRIRSLEKQLGVTLFTRSRKGMRLTAEGESLLRYVQAASDLESETLSLFSGKATSGAVEVCIAGHASILRARMIERACVAVRNFKNVRLNFDCCEEKEVIHKLKNGLAQIAILQSSDIGKELDAKPLANETFGLYVSSLWKKRKLEDILENEAAIEFSKDQTFTQDLLRKNKISKFSKSRHYVNNFDGLAQAVQLGLGYTALPSELALPLVKSGLVTHLNSKLVLERKLSLVWYPRSEMAPYFKSLLNTLSKK